MRWSLGTRARTWKGADFINEIAEREVDTRLLFPEIVYVSLLSAFEI